MNYIIDNVEITDEGKSDEDVLGKIQIKKKLDEEDSDEDDFDIRRF